MKVRVTLAYLVSSFLIAQPSYAVGLKMTDLPNNSVATILSYLEYSDVRNTLTGYFCSKDTMEHKQDILEQTKRIAHKTYKIPEGRWELTSYECAGIQHRIQDFFPDHYQPELKHEFLFSMQVFNPNLVLPHGDRSNGTANIENYCRYENSPGQRYTSINGHLFVPVVFDYPPGTAPSVIFDLGYLMDEGAEGLFSAIFTNNQFYFHVRGGLLILVSSHSVRCPMSDHNGTLKVRFSPVSQVQNP